EFIAADEDPAQAQQKKQQWEERKQSVISDGRRDGEGILGEEVVQRLLENGARLVPAPDPTPLPLGLGFYGHETDRPCGPSDGSQQGSRYLILSVIHAEHTAFHRISASGVATWQVKPRFWRKRERFAASS